jgi:hypothetical protein
MDHVYVAIYEQVGVRPKWSSRDQPRMRLSSPRFDGIIQDAHCATERYDSTARCEDRGIVNGAMGSRNNRR